jgi:ketosteroid isomerase-like protein
MSENLELVPQENVEIVRAAFDRYLHGDEAAALALFASDIVVTQFPDQLDGRDFHGHQGVREAMAEWIGVWDEWTIELLRARELGERVLAIARQRGRGKTSGVPIDSEVAFLFTMRRGAIARWQMLSTEHEAHNGVGLEE